MFILELTLHSWNLTKQHRRRIQQNNDTGSLVGATSLAFWLTLFKEGFER